MCLSFKAEEADKDILNFENVKRTSKTQFLMLMQSSKVLVKNLQLPNKTGSKIYYYEFWKH